MIAFADAEPVSGKNFKYRISVSTLGAGWREVKGERKMVDGLSISEWSDTPDERDSKLIKEITDEKRIDPYKKPEGAQ